MYERVAVAPTGRRPSHASGPPPHRRMMSRKTVTEGLVPTTYEAFFSAGFSLSLWTFASVELHLDPQV